ncbi:hypothetical protein GpartN1_g7643.t1 [Galdieria partita]|uniref:PH domain-containing protein n=1 Tax=Galdieria partita TaxID=83374 RepID=A0A9C7Q820_9RHOD|nr:hypothetical protein GpartN1_g7643.t1 [Galdieria partita]
MFKLKKDIKLTRKKTETESIEKKRIGERRPSSAAPKTWPLESASSPTLPTDTPNDNSGKQASDNNFQESLNRKQGHLWKWTNYLKGWQRRLFILENGIVSYYEEKSPTLEITSTHIQTLLSTGKLICRGKINLLMATIVPHDIDVCRFALDLGKTIYHLRGDSEEVREQWLSSLIRSQAFLQNLLKRRQSGLAIKLSSSSVDSSRQYGEGLHQNSLQNHLSLASTEEAMLPYEPLSEDISPRSDEMRELQRMKEGLLSELKRIQSKLEETTSINNTERLANLMIEIFGQEDFQNGTKAINGNEQSIVTTTKGFSDLISWGIYVLETTCDAGVDKHIHNPTTRQSSTQLTIPNSVDPPFDEDLDDKETELEFFDAETDDKNTELDAVTDYVSIDDRVSLPLKSSSSNRGYNVSFGQKTVLRRTKLPVHRGDVKRPSLWSVLKDAVGKDVSRISIPVTFNEPLSFLQRMAEDIEYSELLDRASETEDPFQRLLLVSVLAVSHYCSAQERIAKPFNPLLGETFELWLPEKNNLKFMSEQVSHHPPISASFATAGSEEKISWTYSAVHMVANKFWGKSIEVFPSGPVQVTIPRFGDYITYEKATTCVHNILIGRVWIDNYGEMVLKNHTTGDYAIIKLRKTGWLSDMKNFGEVRGIIYDRSGTVQKRMSGTWHDSLYEDLPNGKRQLLWKASKRPPSEDSGGYHFTSYAMFLNELTPDLETHIAPTDSRFRPDQRALENAQYKLASDEKFRLEEKQRAARKKREMNGENYYPSWFEQKWNHYLQRNEWTFNHQYWHHRESHDWSKCPDIF